ncbi:MAG: transcription termination/antitermination NusG family protein [Saccharofermentanales bacterium]
MQETQSIKSYCIFCKSGSEQAVAKVINAFHEGMKAIAPQRIIHEKRRCKWEQHSLALLPGYVFLYTDNPMLDNYMQINITDMYKILQYETGLKELVHEDYEYAMWIYRNHGDISPSKVLADGDDIHVIDGPLLDCHGKILRIDKHKRRALVEFIFDGQKRVISLGADCVRKEHAVKEIQDKPGHAGKKERVSAG